jgi:hypothetical protein
VTNPGGVSVGEAAAAAGWLARNVPTLIRWGKYLAAKVKPATKAGVVVLALLVLYGCVVVKVLAHLPDIPEPPSIEQPSPRPRPLLTPVPF